MLPGSWALADERHGDQGSKRVPGQATRTAPASAETLPLTPASLVLGIKTDSHTREKKMTRRNPDLGKITHPWHFSSSFAASFTYFIIYSHVVPSKSVGVGLVFHRKAVREAEGVGVRGRPPGTRHPAGKGGRWRQGLPTTLPVPPASALPAPSCFPPAPSSTFLKPLSDHIFLLINL